MLCDELSKYKEKNRISFAMPGHKGGRGLAFNPALYDVTELSDTPDMHNKNAMIKESLEFLKDFYKTDMTTYITGGSTSGIFIMLASVCKYGDLVAIARGCHYSVLNACTFLGLKVIIMTEDVDCDLDVLKPVSVSKISETLELHSDIKAVIITSPTYYGECADIRSIADVLHEKGIPLLVDEAHGAHFGASDRLPVCAIDAGADIVVQSAHKTLDALTPSALLHVKSKLVDAEYVEILRSMRETSSPPSYILASIESAVKKITPEHYSELIEACEALRDDITANTDIIMHSGALHDCTRLVFGFMNYAITGFEVSRVLREKYNIDCEFADDRNVICIPTPSNTKDEICFLFESVKKIIAGVPKSKKNPCCSFSGISECNPHKAFYSKTVPADVYKSAGKTAASIISVYPPAIPVIYTGEIITKEAIEYLLNTEQSGGAVLGKESFRVVAE